jgi:hypothetical protein
MDKVMDAIIVEQPGLVVDNAVDYGKKTQPKSVEEKSLNGN